MPSVRVSFKTVLLFACFCMLLLLALFHSSFSATSKIHEQEEVEAAYRRDSTVLVEQMQKELAALKAISTSLEKDIGNHAATAVVGTTDIYHQKATPAVELQVPMAVIVVFNESAPVAHVDATQSESQGKGKDQDQGQGQGRRVDVGNLPQLLPPISFSIPPKVDGDLVSDIATSSGDGDLLGDNAGSLLVVGGTDGSGSRRVVSLLTALGVRMVSEDPETYDIHADIVGGWPKMVAPVLKATHSLHYDPSKMPAATRRIVSGAVKQVLGKIRADRGKGEGSRLRDAGVLKRPEGVSARRIEVGFKAPVSMTLVPLIVSLEPRVMFLHVLRDGRDIAFSANQGPVTKFYEPMYGARPVLGPLSGIRLWNDWNAQLHHWARDITSSRAAFHTARSAISNGGGDGASTIDSKDSFSYFALHSEDLVDPVTAVRFGAITNLAAWVGSSLNENELCCLAVQESVFLGSHDRSAGRGTAKVDAGARYGKWRSRVGNNGQLGAQLHDSGREGLRTFGYEPPRTLAEERAVSASGYQCTLKASDCTSIIRKPEVQFSQEAVCNINPGTDYKGGDLPGPPQTVASLDACCLACRAHLQCRHFTYVPDKCYLKLSRGEAQTDPNRLDGMVSGDVL